jgi:hypothetical protein
MSFQNRQGRISVDGQLNQNSLAQMVQYQHTGAVAQKAVAGLIAQAVTLKAAALFEV